MVSLVAKQNMKIAGKLVKAGEAFEISDRYALTLLATRQAGKAPDKPKKAAKKTKGEETEEPEVVDEKPAEKPPVADEKPKATYKTRAMKAEDKS